MWGGGGERNMNILGCGLEFSTFVSTLLNLEQVEVGLPGKNTVMCYSSGVAQLLSAKSYCFFLFYLTGPPICLRLFPSASSWNFSLGATAFKEQGTFLFETLTYSLGFMFKLYFLKSDLLCFNLNLNEHILGLLLFLIFFFVLIIIVTLFTSFYSSCFPSRYNCNRVCF